MAYSSPTSFPKFPQAAIEINYNNTDKILSPKRGTGYVNQTDNIEFSKNQVSGEIIIFQSYLKVSPVFIGIHLLLSIAHLRYPLV
jgi:hypothetical protein